MAFAPGNRGSSFYPVRRPLRHSRAGGNPGIRRRRRQRNPCAALARPVDQSRLAFRWIPACAGMTACLRGNDVELVRFELGALRNPADQHAISADFDHHDRLMGVDHFAVGDDVDQLVVEAGFAAGQ